MKIVLFVCNHNAGRSQMAQAFFEATAPVPIRSHVLTLAHRQTCECLRRETCDVLAVA